jgi:hypothetical protein
MTFRFLGSTVRGRANEGVGRDSSKRRCYSGEREVGDEWRWAWARCWAERPEDLDREDWA